MRDITGPDGFAQTPDWAAPCMVETSADGGKTWQADRGCSDQNQVDALVRGFREFVSHPSRKDRYPHGIVIRWRGRVQA